MGAQDTSYTDPRNVPNCAGLHKESVRPQGLEALPAEMDREL